MTSDVIISAAVGFAAALVALPIQTLVANSNAMKTLSEVYKNTVVRLQDDVKELSGKIESLTIEAEKWKSLRCDRLGCKNRIPPKPEED